jgi:hypothetical protein
VAWASEIGMVVGWGEVDKDEEVDSKVVVE